MSETAFIWTCKHYDALTKEEFHNIIRARVEVFIVEQDCPYQDLDHKDVHAYHLSIFLNQELAAYARLIPEGISYSGYASIGRVLSSKSLRRYGAGRFLMQKSIEFCKELFPESPIKISAQKYLTAFYLSFGFQLTGEEYMEDGILHVAMIHP